MADGRDDDHNSHSRLRDELHSRRESNPFSQFKSFVDNNLRSLHSAFESIPANIASMQREEQRRREEELDIWHRWTGSEDTPDHIIMERARSTPGEKQAARDATVLLLTEAAQKNAHVPQEKIHALFKDEPEQRDVDPFVNHMLAMGGAWYMPETGDSMPVAPSRWTSTLSKPRWLSVDWFKRSPYSPVRLEVHPDLRQLGMNWRAAFEDLMDASLDKPMSSREYVGMREPHGKPQSTYYGPGLEWMLSLQCRGVLPPLLPQIYNSNHYKSPYYNSPIKLPPLISESLSKSIADPPQRDFVDLMSEVAIKSTSRHYSEPLPLDMPHTEQDLYDSHFLTPNADLRKDDNDDEDEDEDDVWEPITPLKAAATAELVRLVDKSLQSHPVGIRMSRLLDEIWEECEDRDGDPAQWAKYETLFHKQRHAELLKRAEELDGKVPDVWRVLPAPVLELAVLQLEREKFGQEEVDGEESEEWENLLEMVGEKRRATVTREKEMEKPSVLSALTTTKTTRLPDGTVTTEVVLKKRFSDGTETTEESVHTSKEARENQHQEEQQQEEEKPKKKGWFWT